MSRYGISGKEKKRIAPMWETTNALYHYHEKDRAKHLENEEPRAVWVGVPIDFFIGTWQYKNEFKGWIFDTEKEAETAVESFNLHRVRG